MYTRELLAYPRLRIAGRVHWGGGGGVRIHLMTCRKWKTKNEAVKRTTDEFKRDPKWKQNICLVPKNEEKTYNIHCGPKKSQNFMYFHLSLSYLSFLSLFKFLCFLITSFLCLHNLLFCSVCMSVPISLRMKYVLTWRVLLCRIQMD